MADENDKHCCNLWGIRIATALIVIANLIAFAVVESGYHAGKSIFKYSTYGGVLLFLMAGLLFPLFKRSPSDGIMLSVALCLVGASANLSSHVDAIEISAAIAAMIVGPIGFIVFCYLARKQIKQ